jgi:hypothetical protein
MATAVDVDTSIVETGKKVSGDELLPSESVFRTISALRKAYTIGLYLADQYTKMSGLDTLVNKNKVSRLVGVEQDELTKKTEVASAIALFSAAYYVGWDLGHFRTDDLAKYEVVSPEAQVVPLISPRVALNHLVLWIGKRLELPDAQNDLGFAKAAMLMARRFADSMVIRKDSFRYQEPFINASYKLKGTEFLINGFQPEYSNGQLKIEFKRVSLDEIVGNRDAKHFMRRRAQRLACYDVTAKENPFRKLGGLSRTAMGSGEPGTGKTMLIGAQSTLLEDYCEAVGLPFYYNPLPGTIVSTYQGGSAERMATWFAPFADPSRVTYGPIDDAENSLQDRTMQGVSAGVREVVAEFLRGTEGASVIDRGNTAIDIYTNIPDQVDPAARSRVIERFHIGGAETIEDAIDQNYLWTTQYRDGDNTFVNLEVPKYEHLSAQKTLEHLGDFYKSYTESRTASGREILKRVDAKFARNSEEWFAAFFVETKKAYPKFTSRDLRNIQSAVSGRVMDFDIPEEWFQKHDMFFAKLFDEKVKILKGLRNENMKGLSFADMFFQESMRYLDSYVDILDAGFERQVTERVTFLRVVEEGGKRYEASKTAA